MTPNEDQLLPWSRTAGPSREALTRLLRDRLIAPLYQPIVCHETGAAIGYEAFTRPGPESAFDSAVQLFDAAESLGLLWELEDAAREMQLAQAGALPTENAPLLFLNVTPTVIADARFVDRLEQQVARVPGLSPSRLVLEITERAEHGSVERLAARVTELKALGYQIAVDDVGAGVSGLNRLMLLRPHWLKLDYQLTHRLDEDRYKQNLLHFLVHFANLSGVRLIAEGVERREELATLIDGGVRHSQGYLLARPSPGFSPIQDDIAAWMRDRWNTAVMHRGADPRRAELGTLCQPAMCAQASVPTTDVAADLLRDATMMGVVVLDGRRFVGWCGRHMVLEMARGPRSAMPIGLLTPPGVTTLSPTATLGEALSLVSVRTEEELASPLVVAHEDTVVGIVPLRALVSAAAQGTRPSNHGMPLTGLPGRAGADRFIAEQLAKVAGRGESRADLTAAFVDIRGFDDLNTTLGYEAGDRLIRLLADNLRALVLEPAARAGDAMLAHLGGDRFLVIGPGPIVDRGLAGLGSAFGETLRRLCAEAGSKSKSALPTTGLRVLEIPQVLTRASGPRDLHRVEAQLRQRSRRLEPRTPSSEPIRVVDQRTTARRFGEAPAA